MQSETLVWNFLHKKTDKICENHQRSSKKYTVKKISDIPVPSLGVTYQTLPGGNNDVIYKLFPPRESLVSDIPARDGNIEKLFLQCSVWNFRIFKKHSSRDNIPLSPLSPLSPDPLPTSMYIFTYISL